jgi:hypothetical protein
VLGEFDIEPVFAQPEQLDALGARAWATAIRNPAGRPTRMSSIRMAT